MFIFSLIWISIYLKVVLGLGDKFKGHISFISVRNHIKNPFDFVPSNDNLKGFTSSGIFLNKNDKNYPSRQEDSFMNQFVNPEELTGPYISNDGKIINKRRKLYSLGELTHVDDLFVGKFHVEWTVRGVKEKLQYRRRDIKPVPLRTSRFTFAGIGGFILRLWLDGHDSSEDGHIALNLIQQEHWNTLESPICLYAGNIVKGPFFYRSDEYLKSSISLCRLEDVVENNTIKVGVKIAERTDLTSH